MENLDGDESNYSVFDDIFGLKTLESAYCSISVVILDVCLMEHLINKLYFFYVSF